MSEHRRRIDEVLGPSHLAELIAALRSLDDDELRSAQRRQGVSAPGE
jgi:hypothetical protein